jgi:hypothetical protein
MNEVQRCGKNEFGTPPPTYVTGTQLCDEFGADGTVQNIDKECSEDLTVHLAVVVLRQ